jgi:hypothetical protein
VGTELLHSPIRLEPEDSQHHQRHRRVPSASAVQRGLVRSGAIAIAPAPGDSSSRIERQPNTFVLPSGPAAAPGPQESRDEED